MGFPSRMPGTIPVAPYIPPPTREQLAGYAQAETQKRNRSGGTMLGVASALHFLSIPITIVLFKVLVESAARRTISWDELFEALSVTGFLAVFVGGVLAQLIFAFVAVTGAFLLHRGRSSVAIPMIVVGVIALIFSIAVFGGIIGLLGGVLSVAGGVKAKPRPPAYPVPPMFPPVMAPPPYGPPRAPPPSP